MSSKISYLLMLVALFLAACQEAPVVTGTALPTVTETREVVIAAATPTLPPSTPTSLLPSLTPSHTHMPTVPPHPTNTPTLPPTITPTLVPTLIPATPFPSPANYSLRSWTEQDAINVMVLLEDKWQQFNAIDWFYALWVVNYGRSYLALFKEETLWRFPNTSHRHDLEWEIAYDLAMAGNQEASARLVPLLEQELNAQNTVEPDVTFLRNRGFTTQLFAAANLFGDGQTGWVLALGKQATSSYTNDDGAVFAIRRRQDSYVISSVTSFQEAFYGDTFNVLVEDYTNDNLPEITVEHGTVQGGRPEVAKANICIYQWRVNQWHSLLNNANNNPCFTYRGYLYPLQYTQLITGAIVEIEVMGYVNVREFCSRIDHFIFDWTGMEYLVEDIWIDIPTHFNDPNELLCVDILWKSAFETGDTETLLQYMEEALEKWPDPEQVDDVVRDWIKFDTEFPWIFRFQLGRYYALTGDLVKAQLLLAQVASQPLANFEDPWPTMAQTYLDNLDNLEQAEQLLAEFNASLSPAHTLFTWFDVDKVSLELAYRLFAGDDPQTIILELETLITEHCIENRVCLQPYYVLGLVYEVAGDEANAIAAYWQVWHDYPDSYYATVAQYRLGEKK